MIKRFLLFLIIIFPVFFLSSCYELIEKMNLKEDGTGTYKIVLNGSQSKHRLDRILEQDSIGSLKLPNEKSILEKLEESKSKISQIEGISNVNYDLDFDNFIINYTLDFSELADLNQVYQTLFKKDVSPIFFKREGNSFSRTFDESLVDEVDGLLSRYLLFDLKDGNMNTIFVFDGERVESTGCVATKASKTGKSTITQISLGDLLANRAKGCLTNQHKFE